MPLILPARTLDSGFNIDNSLRFNDDDNPRLSKTYGSEGNRKTFSISFWQKKANIDHNNDFLIQVQGSDDATNFEVLNHSSQAFQIGLYHVNMIRTNRLFRDPSAWTHFFFFLDTTQSSESNRFKLYINGVQETSFSQSNIPSQNASVGLGRSSVSTHIGNSEGGTSSIDAYLSEFYYIDGQAKAPTDFGEFNDNGVWVPKKYEGTYGNNGLFLEFKQSGTGTNSSGIGADTSGNDNHFAVSNLTATDVTTDTPTNNFATMNPIHKSVHGSAALPTFSEGNLKLAMNSDTSTSSTIAPSKGKWYVEYKQSENTADNQGYPVVGISACQGGNAGDIIGFRTPDGTNYRGIIGNSTVNNAFGSARLANDIFGFYINLDDDILIVHKNGSDYMGSGASSGLNWSGGLTTNNTQTGVFHFYVQNNSGGTPRFIDEVNFGNPTFSISSSNADANGYGSFEYSPTLSGTNYYSLCTKNLAEYG